MQPESANLWPDVDEDLLKTLEAYFPPVCYRGVGSLEAHLLYAGKVELVQTLRSVFDEQVRSISPEDFDGEEED